MLYHQLGASLSEQLLPGNYVKLCESVWKDNHQRNSSDCSLLHMQKSNCADGREIGGEINMDRLLPPEVSAVYQCRDK